MHTCALMGTASDFETWRAGHQDRKEKETGATVDSIVREESDASDAIVPDLKHHAAQKAPGP